ncbi:hypothetical protein DPMN_035016 [Dreissena polymorpha]|uniref:RRM domain-containing protein n=1 Tax=Dreissena polymorpha TaxID=45954 RepID=A0A9D4RK80_DREPO|nr:hypothetical protein DPMN_035016 [Dreissena polymorpha]
MLIIHSSLRSIIVLRAVPTPEDLDKALELSGKELNGEPVRIDLSKPKAGNEPQEKQVTGGDSKTLFVKNLVEDITEEEIRAFFEGETITEIRLPKKYNGTSKGFGYVVFENDEAAEKMMKEKQGAELKGEKIFLDYTNEKSQHSQGSKSKEFGPSKVLFVRNLSFQVTEDELKEIFEGSKACRIPPNEYGQSKGFGFVEFESVEDAEKAKAEKDGLEIQGREVQLAFANDKPGGFMGGGALVVDGVVVVVMEGVDMVVAEGAGVVGGEEEEGSVEEEAEDGVVEEEEEDGVVDKRKHSATKSRMLLLHLWWSWWRWQLGVPRSGR